jgi:hypothetical protein
VVPRYLLRETDAKGRDHAESFDAPDDRAALLRIKGETRGLWFQLWRDRVLVREGRPRRP